MKSFDVMSSVVLGLALMASRALAEDAAPIEINLQAVQSRLREQQVVEAGSRSLDGSRSEHPGVAITSEGLVVRGLSGTMLPLLSHSLVPGRPGDLARDNGSEADAGDDGFGTEDFNDGSPSPVGCPTCTPECMNVKLFITFPYGPTVERGGALIDSRHVLTSGSSLYDSLRGGWAYSIQVVPAYFRGSRPFGTAWVSGWMTYTAWINNRDEGDNLAVLRLNRSIGALTGWYGYTFLDDQYLELPGMVMYSYPFGKDPFTGVNYDGATLCQEVGSWDVIKSKLLIRRKPFTEFSDVGGYLGEMPHRGQFGSCIASMINGRPYLHAVASHNHRPFYSWYSDDGYATRIDVAKWVDIFVTIGTNTPAVPDLTPLHMTVGYSSLPRGGTAYGNYLIFNDSWTSRTGLVSVKLYLSRDPVITPSDTQVGGDRLLYVNIAGKTGLRDYIQLPIPRSIGTGTWYLGAIVQPDADNGNNATSVEDVQQLSIY